jgi:hypothetical protein
LSSSVWPHILHGERDTPHYLLERVTQDLDKDGEVRSFITLVRDVDGKGDLSAVCHALINGDLVRIWVHKFLDCSSESDSRN